MARRSKGLGRLYKPDARDSLFPLRTLMDTLRAEAVPELPARKTWPLSTKKQLDQGNTPECVAHAGKHDQMASPIAQATSLTAHEEYERCKVKDGDNQDGTDARSLMQVYQDEGIVDSYHWATTWEEAIEFLRGFAGLLFGLWWKVSMFTPKRQADGRMWLMDDSGSIAGGHEVYIIGVNLLGIKKYRMPPYATVVNSWGLDWGDKGRVRVPLDLVRAWWWENEGDL
jgi:hypothetical protein